MKKANSFKKILCVILSCLFLATSFAAISVSAAETTTATADNLGSNTITLDGKIDDAWKNVPSQTLSLRDGTSNDSATFKMLWDNKFLYILADITDNTNHTTNEKWWNNDAIEIVFIAANNDDDGMITRRMHLQRNGSFYGGGYFTHSGLLPAGQDNGAFWGDWKKPAYTADKADGWIAEFAIPINNSEIWSGEYKNAQKVVSLDVVYYSADTTSTNRTGLLGWSANGVNDSGAAVKANLGIVTLIDEHTATVSALGANTVTVDGVIDDIWKNVPSQTLSLRDGTSNDSVTIKMLWTNDYLYVLADIKDNTAHVSNENYWDNDAMELIIVIAGSSKGKSVTKRMHIQRNGVVSGGYFSGDVDEKDVFWGIWKTPKYKDNGENGWVVEYPIPLTNSEVHSGVNKNVQKSVSIDCVYYSADSSSTARTGLLGWSTNGVVDSGTATIGNLGKAVLSDEKLITSELTGASITVGSDLSMNYYVSGTDKNVMADPSKLSMNFTMNGETKTVTEYSVVDNEYVFAFDGIAPQNMGDSIKAELLFDGKVIDVKDGYSIKDNAAELLGEYANDEKTVRFVTDMLNYGAAAQNYANYKTDAPVNDVAGMGEASTAAPTEADKFVLSGNTTEGIKIESASVLFDNVNKIGFKFSISDDKAESVKIMLDGVEVALAELENLGNGSYILLTEELKTTQFDMDFELVLMDGETEVSNLTYSVNSYAYSMKDNAKMGALASALYRLGVSAEAYNA